MRPIRRAGPESGARTEGTRRTYRRRRSSWEPTKKPVSVCCASRDDPFLRLARDVGNQFEVCVVMEHDEIVSLGHSGDEGINQRERSVLAPGGEGCLDMEAPSMGGLIRWQRIKS